MTKEEAKSGAPDGAFPCEDGDCPHYIRMANALRIAARCVEYHCDGACAMPAIHAALDIRQTPAPQPTRRPYTVDAFGDLDFGPVHWERVNRERAAPAAPGPESSEYLRGRERGIEEAARLRVALLDVDKQLEDGFVVCDRCDSEITLSDTDMRSTIRDALRSENAAPQVTPPSPLVDQENQEP